MHKVTHIPAPGTTPSGRAVPYIPEQPGREHPENITAKLGVAEGSTLDKLAAVLPFIIDHAMRTVLQDRHSPEVAERVAADVIARIRRQQDDKPSACQYRDCEDTEPGHQDHYRHDMRVTGEDGSTILDVGMVALSGSESAAIVYVRNEEFTDVASVRAKTAEIRQLLDEADAMADRVFADHKGRS